MAKNHLFRLNVPKTWPIKKKEHKFIMKSMPGPHSLQTSMPLAVLLKELSSYANTTKEAKNILHNRKIKINGIVRTNPRFAVGIMDTLSIEDIKQHYRVILNKYNKFELMPIDEKEAKLKPYKIVGKTLLKKGKVQLNLFDGTNLLVDKDIYKVGDTLVLDTSKKIKNHLKFEKGALIYIMVGNKTSTIGKLEEIKKFKDLQPVNIVLKTKDGLVETRKEYAFVIGKDKPIIKLKE